MKMLIKISLLILCFVVVITGCRESSSVKKKEIQFRPVILSKFRTFVAYKNVSAVLIVLGEIPSDEQETALAIGDKNLLNQIVLKNFKGKLIEDTNLMKDLISFEAQEDNNGLASGGALVYIVVEGDNVIGYVLPFDIGGDFFQGFGWHSESLMKLLLGIQKKYNVNLFLGEKSI